MLQDNNFPDQYDSKPFKCELALFPDGGNGIDPKLDKITKTKR
jgi:hypothetical protein